ncbi:hypothetical protein [Neoasaia chiangmaiensis]|uniref:Uncharacterized protein n=1 Tax=Neoasaia chiangmaiensis TaxID=320497 RepID=A0A1U9KT44_9PROT|nr:hypothetical protein [Neoasaia chiangmaiensis]AQS88965.1 hypothetical protein A0U93_14730 [Neoasaia chiangmaiensis]
MAPQPLQLFPGDLKWARRAVRICSSEGWQDLSQRQSAQSHDREIDPLLGRQEGRGIRFEPIGIAAPVAELNVISPVSNVEAGRRPPETGRIGDMAFVPLLASIGR